MDSKLRKAWITEVLLAQVEWLLSCLEARKKAWMRRTSIKMKSDPDNQRGRSVHAASEEALVRRLLRAFAVAVGVAE